RRPRRPGDTGRRLYRPTDPGVSRQGGVAQKARRAALIQLFPSCVKIGCDASVANFIPSSDSFADPPTSASKLLRVNPALTSIASESVLTPNISVAVRVAASIPEIASPVTSTLNASSPRATAVWDWTSATKASRRKSATSSPEALFAAATGAPTLGGGAMVTT